MNRKDEWMKEPVSEELKNKIFSQVLPELEENKKRHQAELLETGTAPPLQPWYHGLLHWKKALSFSVIAMAFVSIIFIRSLDVINIQPTTTFSELASLTPEEFEVIENLDFIDELENINLEDIRREMKQKKKGKRS